MRIFLSLSQKCAAVIPNMLVLSILVGIGYWGHTQHWRIPSFAELVGTTSALSPIVTAEATDDRTPSVTSGAGENHTGNGPVDLGDPVATEQVSGDPSSLPLIRFSSGEALHKSGITIGSVEERRMNEFVTGHGTVTYDETRLAQLSCRVSGIVWRVEKNLGDPVSKGDILAIFDSNEVGRAKAEVLEADVKSDLAIETMERLKAAGPAVASRALREAEGEIRLTRVRRFNAQQALLNLGLPLSLQAMTDLSDEKLAEELHFLGLPAEVVASLDPETASANLIPLISPLDGVVINRNIVKGEVVEPTQMQFTVADVRRMWLILNVPREASSGLEVGQSVYFSSSGLPGEFETKLTWIATEMDKRTRSVQVRAEVENSVDANSTGKGCKQFLFRANMFGSGRIRVRQTPKALVVPSSAVQWDGTRHLVFSPQKDGMTFRALPVQLGVNQDGYTEIRSGVTLGLPIVATGSYLLKSELLGVED